MDEIGLDGKSAIVTGAGRGIGREIALMLARHGVRVLVNDLGVSLEGEGAAATPAEETAAAIQAAGGAAIVNAESVAHPEAAERMVAQALDAFGRLDIVINNAGIIRERPFFETTIEDWDATLKVHLYGSFYLARAAVIPFRAQRSGAYIHMTSSTALVGRRNLAAYAAAKMGIVGLSRALALELREDGIRSNCIAPAAATRMSPQRATPEKDAAYKENVRSDQVAPLAVFLASDAAAGITGQIIGVRRNELYLYSQPRPVRTLHRGAGWTVEALAQQLVPAWRSSFVPPEETQDVFAWDAI